MICGQNLERSSHETSGNVRDRFVAEAEREYLCVEDSLVHRVSHILHGGTHSFACPGRQVSPANPYRREEGRTREDALEFTVGPDHRDGSATRNAFFAGPPRRASILPALFRD